MQLIDGKQIAIDIKSEIAREVKELVEKGKDTPHLAVLVVGEDGASRTYVESIKRACQEVGFTSSVYQYSASTKESELLTTIDFLNSDEEVNGYIVQLPLPEHISTDKIIERMSPDKDVDCFHPLNNGKLMLGKETYLPATPFGTMELLRRSGIETEGKNCVVVGRSNIVGTPLALLLSRNNKNGNATVTLCHSKSKNLKEICAQADILLVAIGKPEMITADYVKKDAVVIDIGIHRIEDKSTEKGYRICGDVKFDEVSEKSSFITPVPGGVGAVTMACLLLNTLKAYKKMNAE